MTDLCETLKCPITLEIFNEPVLAQDGHTYEKSAIERWIQDNGNSPLTRQPLSLSNLYPNYTVKKMVECFEEAARKKGHVFLLNVDVRKKENNPFFSTDGKSLFRAEWLSTDGCHPQIVLLVLEGARAQKQASFYVELSRHPQIVRTFGFVREDNDNETEEHMLLQEYAPEGDLRNFMKNRREPIIENVLIEIFLQIIEAMIYLAHNKIVHGDLACRNVLVFQYDEINPKKIVTKLTDFGISQYSKLYVQTPTAKKSVFDKIPIRYTAPEILQNRTNPELYTEKSDVYSMGVLMWEAYSKMRTPWRNISDDDAIEKVIKGEKLHKPSTCSPKIWATICKTWSVQPTDRPTFKELKCLLTEYYHHKGN